MRGYFSTFHESNTKKLGKDFAGKSSLRLGGGQGNWAAVAKICQQLGATNGVEDLARHISAIMRDAKSGYSKYRAIIEIIDETGIGWPWEPVLRLLIRTDVGTKPPLVYRYGSKVHAIVPTTAAGQGVAFVFGADAGQLDAARGVPSCQVVPLNVASLPRLFQEVIQTCESHAGAMPGEKMCAHCLLMLPSGKNGNQAQLTPSGRVYDLGTPDGQRSTRGEIVAFIPIASVNASADIFLSAWAKAAYLVSDTPYLGVSVGYPLTPDQTGILLAGVDSTLTKPHRVDAERKHLTHGSVRRRLEEFQEHFVKTASNTISNDSALISNCLVCVANGENVRVESLCFERPTSDQIDDTSRACRHMNPAKEGESVVAVLKEVSAVGEQPQHANTVWPFNEVRTDVHALIFKKYGADNVQRDRLRDRCVESGYVKMPDAGLSPRDFVEQLVESFDSNWSEAADFVTLQTLVKALNTDKGIKLTLTDQKG